MFSTIKHFFLISILLNVNLFSYNANFISPYDITLKKFVEDISDKILNNKFDEINILEKWIIRLLVRQNIKKKMDDIEQKESWMFRQG
jgi:hypothetical protein